MTQFTSNDHVHVERQIHACSGEDTSPSCLWSVLAIHLLSNWNSYMFNLSLSLCQFYLSNSSNIDLTLYLENNIKMAATLYLTLYLSTIVVN